MAKLLTQSRPGSGSTFPGLDVNLNPSAFLRADLTQEISSGSGLADGRRAMGDHWAVETFRWVDSRLKPPPYCFMIAERIGLSITLKFVSLTANNHTRN